MLELRGLKEDSKYEGSRQRGNSMDQGVMPREAQFGGEGGRRYSVNFNAILTSISRSLARFSSLISEYLENLDSVISSLIGLEYK